MVNIIIVNWNTSQQLADVVASIKNHHEGLVESVIIVDNASTDNSLALLETQVTTLPFALHVIRNKENRGFAVACNQGSLLAKSEYILFLNPDTRLFKKSLSDSLAFMGRPENDKVGICGIQLVDETGKISRSCARFPSVWPYWAGALGISKLPWLRSWNHHMRDWDHASTREVDHVIGAFYLVRRTLFEKLKGFDERYFVYLEDLDFSLRANKAGWKSIFLADVQAFHAGGGTSRQVKAIRLFYSLRSRLLYGFKHFSSWCVFALLLLTMLIEPFSRLIYSFFRGGKEDVLNTLSAYKMLWHDIPGILRRGFRPN